MFQPFDCGEGGPDMLKHFTDENDIETSGIQHWLGDVTHDVRLLVGVIVQSGNVEADASRLFLDDFGDNSSGTNLGDTAARGDQIEMLV